MEIRLLGSRVYGKLMCSTKSTLNAIMADKRYNSGLTDTKQVRARDLYSLD